MDRDAEMRMDGEGWREAMVIYASAVAAKATAFWTLASIFGSRKTHRIPCVFSEDFVANQKREKF